LRVPALPAVIRDHRTRRLFGFDRHEVDRVERGVDAVDLLEPTALFGTN
jgi:hypothetical protein